MLAKVLDEYKINHNVTIFIIVGVMFYFLYVFNINLNLKENFKSMPKNISFDTKQVKKEIELLKKIKLKYQKKCKPDIKIINNVMSEDFDVSKQPKELMTWPLEKRKKQNLKHMIETDSGERDIKTCLPKLTFDGI